MNTPITIGISIAPFISSMEVKTWNRHTVEQSQTVDMVKYKRYLLRQ